MIQLKLIKPIWLILCILTFCVSISSAGLMKMQSVSDSNIVLFITTPNMKPSGPIKGDYDRVKLALAKEFNADVRGFSTSKKAFILYTNSTDISLIEVTKKRVTAIISDAKIESITFGELKKLRL